MPTLNHIHQYRRIRTNKHIFICADPHCTHSMPKDRLEGKASICNRCGTEFILDRNQLNNKIPVCLNCSKSKKKESANAAKSLIEEILGSTEKIA